tara:strand:- start:14799 stop:17240 length:2442 start_codon:yes stop_codon:yes gene_type:complete
LIWDTLNKEEQLERNRAQILYEQEILEYGRQKYWDDYDRAPDEGLPEQELIDSSVNALRDEYQTWIDKVCASPKSPNWIYPLLELGAQKMADITIRAVIRSWFSSNFWGQKFTEQEHVPPLAQTVATLIAQDACDVIGFQRSKENHKDEWLKQSKFIKNWTPKRCKAFTKKVQENIKLTVKQKHDFGHHMLRIAASSNIILLEGRSIKRGKSLRSYLFVEFHPDVLRELHERHDLLKESKLVYRPMLCPPVEHSLIESGGYVHTTLRKPIVQKYKSNFFGDKPIEQKFSEPSQLVIDGLNGMMQTEWSVNEKIYDVMKTLFENNTGLANLPVFEFESFMYNAPYPKGGSKEEKAIWCQQREQSWSDWYKSEQARGRMLVRLALAKEMIGKGFFYHVYTLDFRGRAYTICELLSPQSSDFDKGLIQFANGVELTDEGRYWQKINLANQFDQDHLSFDDRIKWVDKNWEMIERIANDPYENKEWVDDSIKKNKSFQRLAACFDITRDDNLTFIPIQVDGKCNGNQHWSAIMGDPTIADLTSVTPNDEPQDLYQYVADITTQFLNEHKNNNTWFDTFLSHWDGRIDRKVTKRSTMCEPYGLTFYGIQKYIKTERHLDWIPNERRGGAIVELSRAIKASLDRALAEPNKGKLYLKELVTVANDLNKHVEWVTPSGFKVVHHYNKITTRRSLAKLFNNKELTFFVRTDDVDTRSALQAIAPNFIHSLDAAHMFLCIYSLLWNGIKDLCMIHDSFGCHANYVGLMNTIIRREFLVMHKDNQLELFKKSLENLLGTKLPNGPERGDLDLEQVLKSLYFFA